jgi:hypothetical protein
VHSPLEHPETSPQVPVIAVRLGRSSRPVCALVSVVECYADQRVVEAPTLIVQSPFSGDCYWRKGMYRHYKTMPGPLMVRLLPSMRIKKMSRAFLLSRTHFDAISHAGGRSQRTSLGEEMDIVGEDR